MGEKNAPKGNPFEWVPLCNPLLTTRRVLRAPSGLPRGAPSIPLSSRGDRRSTWRSALVPPLQGARRVKKTCRWHVFSQSGSQCYACDLGRRLSAKLTGGLSNRRSMIAPTKRITPPPSWLPLSSSPHPLCLPLSSSLAPAKISFHRYALKRYSWPPPLLLPKSNRCAGLDLVISEGVGCADG